jgi:hypothetical protein
MLPDPEPLAVRPVEVPPPERIGITLDDTPAAPVNVPDPEKLGIKLE